MRAAALFLCTLLSSSSTVSAQRPKLSSGAAAKGTSQARAAHTRPHTLCLSADICYHGHAWPLATS